MFFHTPVACRRVASLLTPPAVVSVLVLLGLLLTSVGISLPTTSG
jgi:hypothetical protein